MGRMSSDALAFGTSRKVEVFHEHVARIERGALARIRHTAPTALAQFPFLVATARIVRPTRIEFVHTSLPLPVRLKPDTTYVSLRALRSPR